MARSIDVIESVAPTGMRVKLARKGGQPSRLSWRTGILPVLKGGDAAAWSHVFHDSSHDGHCPRQPRRLSSLNLTRMPAGAGESIATRVTQPFLPPHLPGRIVVRGCVRWLTPPANFHQSFQDGRNTKITLTPCHPTQDSCRAINFHLSKFNLPLLLEVADILKKVVRNTARDWMLSATRS